MELIVEAITFSLPCWVANMFFTLSEPLMRAIPALRFLRKPVDQGMRLGRARVFGDSRMYMSVVMTICIATIGGVIFSSWILCVKVLLTQIGTLVGSFIKRRAGYETGQRMIIIDQADYMIVVGSVSYIFGWVNWEVLLIAIVLTCILQPLVSRIGYVLKLKKNPY